MINNINCYAESFHDKTFSPISADCNISKSNISTLKAIRNSKYSYYSKEESGSGVSLDDCAEFNDHENIIYNKLYRYMQKLKQEQHRLHHGSGGKLISVTFNGNTYQNVHFHRVALMDGEINYAARVAERWVVSDGNACYIDDLVSPPGKSLMSICLELMTQLVAVTGLAWRDINHRNDHSRAQTPTPAGQSTKHGSSGDIRHPQPVFHSSGLGTFYGYGAAFLQNLLTMPGASAKDLLAMPDTRKRHQEGHVSKRSPVRLYGNAPASGIITHSITKLTKIAHKNMLPFADHTPCNMVINLPNADAMKIHARLFVEYNNQTSSTGQTLRWLDGYDRFLAIKVKNIFEQAMYLKDKNESMGIIILKRYCEKIVESCKKVNPNLFVGDDILIIDLDDRPMLNDFFPDLDDTFKFAFKNINVRILREVVAIKNGMTFYEAKSHNKRLHDNQLPASERKLYQIYYKYVSLMERAHALYSNQLSHDNEFTPLERSLYHNNRHLYMSFIDNDLFEMENVLIIRFFAYILEYNRNSGVSVHSDNLYMPGEFTDLWYLFSKLPELPILTSLAISSCGRFWISIIVTKRLIPICKG